MKMTWNEIRIGCAAVGAWLGWFIGGFDNLLYADSVYNITREILDGLNARYSSPVKK